MVTIGLVTVIVTLGDTLAAATVAAAMSAGGRGAGRFLADGAGLRSCCRASTAGGVVSAIGVAGVGSTAGAVGLTTAGAVGLTTAGAVGWTTAGAVGLTTGGAGLTTGVGTGTTFAMQKKRSK